MDESTHSFWPLLLVWVLTGTLEGLNVLWALGELSDGLNEGDASLLVGLKGGKNCTGHVSSLSVLCIGSFTNNKCLFKIN